MWFVCVCVCVCVCMYVCALSNTKSLLSEYVSDSLSLRQVNEEIETGANLSICPYFWMGKEPEYKK